MWFSAFICVYVCFRSYVSACVCLCMCRLSCVSACMCPRVCSALCVSSQVPWNPDVDACWHALLRGVSDECEPEWCNSEDALFILYTSGSTGKPKVAYTNTPGGAQCMGGDHNLLGWVLNRCHGNTNNKTMVGFSVFHVELCHYFRQLFRLKRAKTIRFHFMRFRNSSIKRESLRDRIEL